jgi:hypothetical protein
MVLGEIHNSSFKMREIFMTIKKEKEPLKQEKKNIVIPNMTGIVEPLTRHLADSSHTTFKVGFILLIYRSTPQSITQNSNRERHK